MAESTALEALTAELLGDVLKLHTAIKSLDNTLPAASAEFSKQTQFQIGTLVKAKQDLLIVMSQIQDATKKSCDEYAQKSIKHATDAASIEIKREAANSVRQAIYSGFNESIGKMNTAAENITNKADIAGNKFIEMKNEIRSDRINGLLKTAAVALICSLVVVFGAKMSGAFDYRLSDADLQEITVGRAIIANWQNLSASDRQRIKEMMTRQQQQQK